MTNESNGPDQSLAIRAKLLKVYRYLDALNQVRNPVQREIGDQPWTMWFHDLPDHEAVSLGKAAPASSTASTEGDDFILKVRRPEVTSAPEPPADILSWLEPGWQEPTTVPTTKAERKVAPPDTEPYTERFEDQVTRVTLYTSWLEHWEKWAETELPAREALLIFDRLYDLHARLEREGERLELLVGDGILNWRPQGQQGINHPVLLQRLQLEFDPEVPEFTLLETEQSPELYTALLRSVDEVEARAIKQAREELDVNAWHPLGGEETVGYFRRLTALLSAHGKYSSERPQRTELGAPFIWRDPVLFLRPRTQGFATAIEAIVEDISTRTDFPTSLVRIIGIGPTEKEQNSGDSTPSLYENPNGEDEAVLLSKPANLEQLEIARRLDKHGAVLVQGPPGTGKTHTIANLLGHLLAQGKSVLVTSHTAKALKVLREKVVKDLQPLCVSVVDDTTEQLEQAVDGITERLASVNVDELERQARGLAAGRVELLRRLREARQRLRIAREDEYRPVVVAGKSFTPAEAARIVSQGRGQLDWIPTPVTAGEPSPLTAGELVDLYRSNELVTHDDERELGLALPDIKNLPTPSEFEQVVAERHRLSAEDLEYRRDLWAVADATAANDDLLNLQRELSVAVEPLGAGEAWRLAAIEAGREEGAVLQAWSDLITEVEAVVAQAAAAQPILLRHGPTVPDGLMPGRLERVLGEMEEHVKRGGGLGMIQYMLHREWKTVVEQCRISGKAPETAEHFEALRVLVRLADARRVLLDRWGRQMAALGAPSAHTLGAEPERACRQFIESLRTCLCWHDQVWAPLEARLIRHGFRWSALLGEMPPDLTAYGDLNRLRMAAVDHLPRVTTAEVQRRSMARNRQWVATQLRQLEQSIGREGQAEALQRLRQALVDLDAVQYREWYQRLADLNMRRTLLATRLELLRRLEAVAPGWAASIRDRKGCHGQRECPTNPAEAWLWRQLNDELERRAATAMEELQGQIRDLSEQLQQLTGTLVEKRSWASQVRRTTHEQRQALNGWKFFVKRAGKRTGKRAPRLLAEARSLMPICQSAVPVWIMPLSRVVENFDPRRNQFDVVIIDEASQSDVMALVALYMGKQVVVVGDSEQVSPSAVGQQTDDVQKLIDEHLQGIPNHNLWDGLFSIYDMALTAFQPVCLREHFRCVSPIIQFSNHLSYGGKITPLRDASEVRRRPHTVAYRVPDTDGSMPQSEVEAQTVASLVVAMTEQPEYTDATIGVIGMVGDEQAMRIDALLRRFMSLTAHEHHKIQCGNPANFQGDERDVILLSMVDFNAGTGPLSLRTEGANDMYKKRFNVAASRARDQMWVVHSLNPDTDLKDGDIRRRLIQHAENPYALVNLMQQEQARAESEFERMVLQRLMGAGYRVRTQWPVGAYRIDMVVEGGGKRLAVECDGDRYHTMDDLPQDMARQAILERLGWRFVRIRGSQFFRNSDLAMRPVFERLEKLGVLPEGAGEGEAFSDQQASELQERIIRRAAEVRREWASAQFDPVVITPTRGRRFGRKPGPSMQQAVTSERVASRGGSGNEGGTHLSKLEMAATASVEPRKDTTEVQVPKLSPALERQTTTSSSLVVQSKLFPDSSGGQATVVRFLDLKGIEYVDNRATGGALWMVGGSELQPLVDKFKEIGVIFSFSEAGGKATKHRSAWFTKSAR